ncbi:MAG: hypothetical protein RLZ33_1153 [Bacteroidota bacterium]
MKLSSNQKYILLFQIICLTVEIVSVFFPFLVKTNVHSGDPSLPRIYLGYQFFLIPFAFIVLFAIAYYSIFHLRIVPIAVLSIVALGLLQLIRFSIHFQGFIDHDYDTNAGSGFYLFFWVVLLQLLGSLSFAIWDRNKRK